MARKYTTKSASFRWPLQVFFNNLDLAAINAWILYTECTGSKLSRKDFLFQLVKELAEGEKKKYAKLAKLAFVKETGAKAPVKYVKKLLAESGHER